MDQLSNRYRLLDLVGQGGMAKVYRAEDHVLGRTVAVKVLREQYAADQAFVGRFVQEARSAASLSHPNIVNVFDVGDDGGRYYIVMEFVGGASLKELIQQQAPFAIDRAVSIARQICAGLQAAHARNLIHRDIKPQNVLVTPEGQVKIADFGIARALGEASFSETGQIFGSIHYLSPEQAQGKQATQASDIYALGVVCYEMLTGRLPFEGETVVGVALRHIQESPQPPHELNPAIPGSLESIILQALAKNPAGRFPAARQMEQALAEYAQLGEQATSMVSAVRVKPSPTASAHTTRVAPVTADAPVAGVKRSSVGGNFLLLILAILAILSVLGLCALSTAVYQSYNDKFALNIPLAGQIVPTVPPLASATAVLVAVPRLEGMNATQAKTSIESHGLVYKEGPPEVSDSVPAGLVIRQSITPGTPVTPRMEVMVVLSKGPDTVDVPFVIGFSFARAQAELEGKGFKVARQEQVSRTAAPDTVYSQDPLPGSRVARGTPVTLTVTKATDKVLVPDVVGKSETEAKKIIEEAGLHNFPWTNPQRLDDLPESLREYARSIPQGHVLSTTPKAGTEVDPGTEVFMSVRKD